jgi:hypothetical protein
MKTADLTWFVTSIAVHALILWRCWNLAFFYERPQSPMLTARLVSESVSSASDKPSRPASQGREGSAKPALSRGRPAPQQKTEPPDASGGSGKAGTDMKGGPSFPGNELASGDTEIPVAPGGSSSGSEGSPTIGGVPGGKGGPTGGDGKAAGAGGGSSQTGKAASAGEGSSTASTPIPKLPQHYYRYRSYSSYYVEVDHYVLEGMNIPGTELCVAGDQLRTKGAIAITQLKTDHSKCRIVKRGDEEKEICPPTARSEVVIFKGYVSSPVSYGVNTCREYDRSHCRIYARDTDREKEYCKVDFKYEGVWDAGTKFEYRCTKSDAVFYSHPLEYNVRYFLESGRGGDDDRIRPKEAYRIKQTIPPCE